MNKQSLLMNCPLSVVLYPASSADRYMCIYKSPFIITGVCVDRGLQTNSAGANPTMLQGIGKMWLTKLVQRVGDPILLGWIPSIILGFYSRPALGVGNSANSHCLITEEGLKKKIQSAEDNTQMPLL